MSLADSRYRASCELLLLTLYFSMVSFYSPLSFSLSLFLSLSLSLSLFLSLSLSLSLFLSLSLSLSLTHSLSLSLSPPSFSPWLQDTCHLMPFTKYPLLNQSYFFTPHPSINHIKFTNYSPTIFYNYHPRSCLKNIFFALGPTVV